MESGSTGTWSLHLFLFGDSLARTRAGANAVDAYAEDLERVMTGISNGRLGMMLLVGTETVLFSTFLGAYLVLRGAASSWPPFGTPHLSLDLSSVNTGLLILSTVLAYRRRIGWTFMLGCAFLVLQAFEFHRLYARGLTLQTGAYGALFYSLITCHGLHVLGGLVLLAVAFRKTAWAEYAEIYWHFVTGVWLVLFGVLYIA
jgi:cytochrome c oxidase subunit 3